MLDTVALVALALLAAGVVASVIPGIPSGLLGLAGVYVEFVFGPDRLGLWLLVGFTAIGVLTVVVDLFGGAVAARGRGASTSTTIAAAATGLVLFLVVGPLGVVLGIFLAVVTLERYREGRTVEAAFDRAIWATAGMLASGIAVFLLASSMLTGYAVFVLWLG